MTNVTNKDIVLLMGEIKGALAQVIVKLDDHRDRMNRIDEDIEDTAKVCLKRTEKLSQRVNRLEAKQHTIVVVTTAVWALGLVLLKFAL
jgi:LPS sulfotransferase NodH